MQKALRPISLTVVLSKCLERHICTLVMDVASNILDLQQYGSIKGSSTVHALVELVHKWHLALDTPSGGNTIRALQQLLDFSKAFDRVEHNILMRKLADLGLPHFIIQWLTAFLRDRKQRVKIGSVESDRISINAGVPQGTLLGPVSFLFYINDLHTSCNVVKYVDDSTIWETCSVTGANSILQDAATEAAVWSKNKMALNGDKTKEMRISFSRAPPSLDKIVLDDRDIELVSENQTSRGCLH